jgi:Tfp pilus assembly protein PilN
VRPVNLLPERHRPRTPTGGRQGSSYILLGVLGAVLVAALIYVLTLNQINSRRDAVAQAKNQTASAKSQIQALGAYGNFVQVKNARVQAVKQLADGRIDWEMAMRELARVLPSDVWLVSADASTGDGDTAASSATQAPSPNPASGGASDTATLTLTGCAKSQDEVAVTLVRLRQMNGASDVSLNQSTSTKADGGSGGDSAAASGGCTPGTYQFQANVTLSNEHTGADKVSPSLGGGS